MSKCLFWCMLACHMLDIGKLDVREKLGSFTLIPIAITMYTYFHSSAQILRLRHDYFVHETDEIFTAVCRIRVPVFFKYTRTV